MRLILLKFEAKRLNSTITIKSNIWGVEYMLRMIDSRSIYVDEYNGLQIAGV